MAAIIVLIRNISDQPKLYSAKIYFTFMHIFQKIFIQRRSTQPSRHGNFIEIYNPEQSLISIEQFSLSFIKRNAAVTLPEISFTQNRR